MGCSGKVRMTILAEQPKKVSITLRHFICFANKITRYDDDDYYQCPLIFTLAYFYLVALFFSPILGESASMCIVPPLNLEDGSSQEGTDNDPDTVRQTEERDGKFMQNLLSQVCPFCSVTFCIQEWCLICAQNR